MMKETKDGQCLSCSGEGCKACSSAHQKETSFKEKIEKLIEHTKVDPSDCGCYICHHQEEFREMYNEILNLNGEAMLRLKIKFCKGREFDTIVKGYCKKGDNYYCEECKGIDEIFGEKLSSSLSEKIRKNPRIVNENDLQKMEYIELSYSGDLIPVEEVEILLGETASRLKGLSRKIKGSDGVWVNWETIKEEFGGNLT